MRCGAASTTTVVARSRALRHRKRLNSGTFRTGMDLAPCCGVVSPRRCTVTNRNEGEGSRSAARKYNEGATKTAKKKIPDAAPRSEREREEMEQAEEEGRARAKELDPEVDRDYSRPTK
jgi:hypothetical protein